ncbi:RagB/SusD family nutrient uptake outer membrane protein [Chitinophaga varians]|uniref:RagB/SusD family nutrient uptake outer membrane protein n=1 Tax=Chitinophaga varians TaxID=2202339 RepID=UPI00165FF9E4|nr:RagB/SusD family nutrient uptake outer membrane protein [Chitinophaga varians]MBC9909555.1 RagB/SusD family nutrient uptake outer membrane protein [Chitinophaga varians]
MKLSRTIITAVLSLLVLSACKKEFLNTPSPEDGNLTDNIIFSNKAGAESAMTGIYWIFRSENYNGYGGDPNNSGNLTCRGLQTTMFFYEVRGNDVFEGLRSWWRWETAWEENASGRIQTGSRTRQIWDMFYKAINNANAIIKYTPGITGASDAEKATLIAEAKALRAYSYFWLARSYQYTYAKNPNAAGVPLYTEPASKDSKGNPRAPLKEVYQLILSDLEEATTKLTDARTEKFRINKNVAQGILAEVYQEMAMSDPALWQKAVDNAKAARDGFPLMSNTSYASGFNDLSNPEWMWGFPVPEDQSLTYYSQYSFMDVNSGYYRNIFFNNDFVNSYSATDARRALFIDNGDNPAAPARRWSSRKYRSRLATSITGDILVMRAAEMYLIEAEGLAQQGKLAEAIDVLFAIQALRDPAAVKPPASIGKDALIDLILLERRKEMYGEAGVYYFDLKRYQRNLVRTGNHPYLLNIAATDPRWLIQIPISEMDANDKINPEDQNP